LRCSGNLLVFCMCLITVITYMQPVPLLKKNHKTDPRRQHRCCTAQRASIFSYIYAHQINVPRSRCTQTTFLASFHLKTSRESLNLQIIKCHTITIKHRHAAFDFIAYINVRRCRILLYVDKSTK
jgi:hypothetical protein